MPKKYIPDSLRTVLVGSQSAEGSIAGTLVTLRAVTSFEPLYNDSYEMPRFENASGWAEEEAYGTTSTRGMRLTMWLDSNDVGWFLANVMRCADVKTGSSAPYTHVMTAVNDNLLANPCLTLAWTDGTSLDKANLALYQMIDGRVTQFVMTWDYMANSWRVTVTVDATPYPDATMAVATASVRNRLGKIMLPKHSSFRRGVYASTTFTGTAFSIISGNITLNNNAGVIYGSVTGNVDPDPDGTASQAVTPLRREDGNMSGRYDIVYDKALFKRYIPNQYDPPYISPFEDYLSGTHESWNVKVAGIGGGHSLLIELPYGKFISGNENLAGQRSTRDTVQGMIGIDQAASKPTFPFQVTLVNGYGTAYSS